MIIVRYTLDWFRKVLVRALRFVLDYLDPPRPLGRLPRHLLDLGLVPAGPCALEVVNRDTRERIQFVQPYRWHCFLPPGASAWTVYLEVQSVEVVPALDLASPAVAGSGT
jgi:hypothetical protein